MDGLCIPEGKTCDFTFDCMDYSDENCTQDQLCSSVTCDDRRCVPLGSNSLSVSHLDVQKMCMTNFSIMQVACEMHGPDYSSCGDRSDQCFPRNKACVHDLNHKGNPSYCISGENIIKHEPAILVLRLTWPTLVAQ